MDFPWINYYIITLFLDYTKILKYVSKQNTKYLCHTRKVLKKVNFHTVKPIGLADSFFCI